MGGIILRTHCDRVGVAVACELACGGAGLFIRPLTQATLLPVLAKVCRERASLARSNVAGIARSSGPLRVPDIEEKLKKVTHSVSAETWKARILAALVADQRSALRRISVPLLYLRASEDNVIFRSASTVISQHLPGAKIVEIEGPHFLLQTKPRDSAAAVTAFANGTRAGAWLPMTMHGITRERCVASTRGGAAREYLRRECACMAAPMDVAPS